MNQSKGSQVKGYISHTRQGCDMRGARSITGYFTGVQEYRCDFDLDCESDCRLFQWEAWTWGP